MTLPHIPRWHYRARTVASFLPQWALVRLHRRWPLNQDPSDGWTLWMDASYERWVRHDRRLW